eukprot:tig00020592_g11677.t1
MDHVLPSEYTGTMRVLQDQAPFRPYDDVERVVLETSIPPARRSPRADRPAPPRPPRPAPPRPAPPRPPPPQDLGAPPDEVFAEFDRHPLASASLAQVHRARLRDGRECAVKPEIVDDAAPLDRRGRGRHDAQVQYRGLREKCHGDILTITYPSSAQPSPPASTQALSNLPAELDFKSEGRNSERLARNFAHRRDVHVPRVHWELTTHRVLTMEFIHGCKVNDLEGLQMMRVDPSAVATKLGEVFSEQIFLHGFVHSDPHPGNIMVRPLAVAEAHARQWGPSSVPPSGPSLLSSLLLSPLRRLLSLPGSLLQWPWRRAEAQLVLLDHGLYRELEDSFRLDYARLWKALIVRDMPGIKRYSAALGAPRFEILATMLTARPHHSSKVGLGTKLSKEEVEHLRRVGQEWVTEIVDILASVPRPMLLLFKTNDLLRSVNRDLGASVNPFLIMAAYCVDALNAHALAQPATTVDLLRSVNRDLGASVNPFLIMAAYCVDALNAHALAQHAVDRKIDFTVSPRTPTLSPPLRWAHRFVRGVTPGPGLRTLLEAAWAELDLSARLRAYALLLRAAGLWESVLGFAARSLLPAPSTAALDREPFEARGVPPRPL